MRNDRKARQLAQYIEFLPDFAWCTPGAAYNHIGATIADAVLQANRNYRKIVAPRVSLIRERYSEATTTTALRRLLCGIPATRFLQYNNPQRARRFSDVVEFFYCERIDDEHDLQHWLERSDSAGKLCKLKDTSPKTADYFRLLLGLQTQARDRHLYGFAKMAGITSRGHADANDIIRRAADILGRSQDDLAHSIWRHMRTATEPCLANERQRGAPRTRYWFRFRRGEVIGSR
jgi:hypothetical protein